eukprot:261353_1
MKLVTKLFHHFPYSSVRQSMFHYSFTHIICINSTFISNNIKYILNNTNEDIYVSIDCFNNTSPALICIVDQSSIGNTVELDGEFQKQGDIFVNSHPVWLKEGMNGIWDDYYIWLTIDHSYGADAYSWKWVIGTDYNDDSTIYAECLAPWSDHMTDPTQCSGNWYKNQKLLPELVSRNGVCDLGDNYVCVESADGGLFDIYFDGQYRQIHSGVPLWFLEDGLLDAYLTIGTVSWPPLFDNTYVFAFALNQTQMFAFCPIGQELPSKDVLLNPQHCNKNWYKLELDPVDATKGFIWVEDYVFDIDECKHKDISTTRPPNNINEYPQILCMNDIDNG